MMFVNGFAMGGTERQVVNLGRAIDRSQFDIHLACFSRRGHYLEEIEACRLPIWEYPINSLHNHRTIWRQWAFARNLRRHRIQIVHTFNFYPNVFALPAARMARTPHIVASIRDLGIYQTPMQKRVQRLACRLADCIVVNAEPKPRLRSVSPQFTSSITGNHFLAPGDFATIYDLNTLYSTGIDGTGETIAVIGQTLISTTDIDAFRTAAGLPARTSSNFVQVQVPGTGTAMRMSRLF